MLISDLLEQSFPVTIHQLHQNKLSLIATKIEI